MTRIDRADSRAEARRRLAWLRAAGIAAAIERDDAGGFSIAVDSDAASAAAAVLERVRGEPDREVLWICPACAEENASTFEVCWRCSGSLDAAVAREADAPPSEAEPDSESRLGESGLTARRRAFELGVLLLWFVGWRQLANSLWPVQVLDVGRILPSLGCDLVVLAILVGIFRSDRAAFPRARDGAAAWAMACGLGVVLGVVQIGVTDIAYAQATRAAEGAVLFPEPGFASGGARTLWRVYGYPFDVIASLFFVRFVIERVRSFAPLPVAISASCLLEVLAFATTVPEAIYLAGTTWLPAVAYAYLRDLRPVILAAWIVRTLWLLPLL